LQKGRNSGKCHKLQKGRNLLILYLISHYVKGRENTPQGKGKGMRIGMGMVLPRLASCILVCALKIQILRRNFIKISCTFASGTILRAFWPMSCLYLSRPRCTRDDFAAFYWSTYGAGEIIFQSSRDCALFAIFPLYSVRVLVRRPIESREIVAGTSRAR